jgi:two-component system sensor histidine kinase VicK
MESYENEPDLDFFQLIGEQAHQVFFIFNPFTHQFYYLNATFEGVWKTSREAVLESPSSLFDTIYPEDRQYVAENYSRFMAHQRTSEIEFRILWPDSTDRWIRLWAYPILQEDRLQFIAGIALDDSKKKKNFFHMEKINAKKDATMEILSHDLKGPISLIHSFAFTDRKKNGCLPDKQIVDGCRLFNRLASEV